MLPAPVTINNITLPSISFSQISVKAKSMCKSCQTFLHEEPSHLDCSKAFHNCIFKGLIRIALISSRQLYSYSLQSRYFFFFWKLRCALIAAAILKAIEKLREEGQTSGRGWEKKGKTHQPLPLNHFLTRPNCPRWLENINVVVCTTKKACLFAGL